MLVISATDVEQVLDMDGAIGASADAYVQVARRVANVPVRHLIPIGDAAGSVTLFMPGFLTEQGVLGVKVGSLFTGNPPKGLPVSICTVLLVDPTSGAALSVIEATWLTRVRTGAGVGVATRALAREDSAVLGLIGAGNLAFHQVEAALTARRTISRVNIWNRGRARAEALAATLREAFGTRAEFTVMDSAEAVARSSDVITVATSSPQPVLRGAWVKPGTHVNLTGARSADMREGDDDLVGRSAVRAVDMLDAASASGEVARPVAAGIAAPESFVEIGAILDGRSPGRTSRDDITWFKSVGIAAQDLTTAKFTYDAARRKGLGTTIAIR